MTWFNIIIFLPGLAGLVLLLYLSIIAYERWAKRKYQEDIRKKLEEKIDTIYHAKARPKKGECRR